jgi:hypothetical protein
VCDSGNNIVKIQSSNFQSREFDKGILGALEYKGYYLITYAPIFTTRDDSIFCNREFYKIFEKSSDLLVFRSYRYLRDKTINIESVGYPIWSYWRKYLYNGKDFKLNQVYYSPAKVLRIK